MKISDNPSCRELFENSEILSSPISRRTTLSLLLLAVTESTIARGDKKESTEIKPENKFPDNDDYTRVYREKGHPFEVTDEIEKKAKELTLNKETETEKARAIFDWMVAEFSYGQTKIRSRRGFDKTNKNGRKMYCWKGVRHAPEIFNDREAVCGERSELYIAMARSIGLNAAFIHVSVDSFGRDKMLNSLTGTYMDFGHGCVAVYADKKVLIIDPTYEMFDAKHKKFTIKSNSEAVKLFKGYDRKTICGYY